MIKTVFKKSVSTLLLILTLCVLVPSIAPQKAEALTYSQPNVYQIIAAYNGNGSKYMIGKGYRGVIQAHGTSDGLNISNRWLIQRAPDGLTGYVFAAYNANTRKDDLYLNYTRTVTAGIYNNATQFDYEYGLRGVDQRVSFVSAGSSGSYYIRLVEKPNQLHSNYVYLMCDKSSPSTTTDVIWYTDTSKDRAIWK